MAFAEAPGLELEEDVRDYLEVFCLIMTTAGYHKQSRPDEFNESFSWSEMGDIGLNCFVCSSI